MCAHKIGSSKIYIAMLMYNTVAQGGHFGLFGKSVEERRKPGVDQENQGYSDSKMQINQETFLGLHYSAVSHRLGEPYLGWSCQDPLEKFFGCLRQRGSSHENPNVYEHSSTASDQHHCKECVQRKHEG
jgi:hypothetical protein